MILDFIKQNWRYFLKYAIVGVSGTVIDIGGYATMIRFTSLHWIVANTISVTAAIINNFTWNKLWTFKDHAGTTSIQFTKFVLVSLGGLLLNNLFLWLFRNTGAYFVQETVVNLPYWLDITAKFGASGAVLTYNFLLNRFWTFHPEPEETPRPEAAS